MILINRQSTCQVLFIQWLMKYTLPNELSLYLKFNWISQLNFHRMVYCKFKQKREYSSSCTCLLEAFSKQWKRLKFCDFWTWVQSINRKSAEIEYLKGKQLIRVITTKLKIFFWNHEVDLNNFFVILSQWPSSCWQTPIKCEC